MGRDQRSFADFFIRIFAKRVGWKWFTGYRGAGGCEKRWKEFLLRLAADALTDQLAKPALWCLAELVVVVRLLADYETPAAVPGIKPLGRGIGDAVRTVKPHPRAHLDKRTTLGKLSRILVFHAHQRRSLIVLEYADRADRNLVSRFGLSNGLPLSGGPDEGNQQDSRHRYRENEEEGLFQCKFPSTNLQHYFGLSGRFCQSSKWLLPVPGRLHDIVYAPATFGRDYPRKALHMETLYSTTLASPVGPLFLAASDKGLVALEFDARLPGQQTIRPNPRDLRSESDALSFQNSGTRMSSYTCELEEYFTGNRRKFSFPLDLRGTPFQLECWHALLEIPYGETRTYADIARAVGRPRASVLSEWRTTAIP